jgi:DinB family protein
MAPFDAHAELATLATQYDAIEALLALDPARLAEIRAAVSGWSAEQHLAHVTLANELVLRNVKSLSTGQGLLVHRGGEPVAGTREILVAGRIPRGRAQSPRIVRPPERVQRELLGGWLHDGRAALAELRAFPASVLASGELKISHQILGPLDLTEWARFGVVHTEHHLAIARELLC